ncbi:MAG: mechanosensitive ion channel [Proteobacteria bacterium]|nr:mechanosensitive ion channel [Pseudomonadota bacterium]MBI3496489.1 mechanosensitive ion channel [Pseudomonadota bacterium]
MTAPAMIGLRLLIAALFGAWLTLAPGMASAQTRPPAAAQSHSQPAQALAAASAAATAIPPDQLKSLIGTLENDAERAKLLLQLKALLALHAPPAQPSEDSPVEALGQLALTTLAARINQLSTDILSATDVLTVLPRVGSWVQELIFETDQRAQAQEVLIKLALVLGSALAGEALVWLGLTRVRRLLEAKRGRNLLSRLGLLLMRAATELAPIAVFGITAYLSLPLTEPSLRTALVAGTLIYALLLARAVNLAGRLLLSPYSAGLRVPAIEDETAAYLYLWIRRFGGLWIYGYFLLDASLFLGLPYGVYRALVHFLGLVLATLGVIFILQNRAAVADWLRGPSSAEPALSPDGLGSGIVRLKRRSADIWHGLAIFYLVAIYLVWALSVDGGFPFILRGTLLTAIVLLAARLASLGQRRLVTYVFSIAEDVKRAYPMLEKRANLYLPILKTVFDAVIFLFAGFALLESWGVASFAWLSTDLGRRLTGIVVNIAFVLGIAVIFWETVSALIERSLKRLDLAGNTADHRARMRTFLPLMHNAIFIMLVVVVSLVVLSELGVNIAPLLAGAGVIGLAVGFGSQTLVKDVITGLFILFEDTINVGDVVDIDGRSGVVESISIRTIRMRDVQGAQITIPFSQVNAVKNMTKDFGYYVFDIAVAYDSDVDHVTATLREVDETVRGEREWGIAILDRMDIFGLDKFTDTAIVVKARIKTRPGRQWLVGREYNRRIKLAFDSAGIVMPHTAPSAPAAIAEPADAAAPLLGRPTAAA